MTSFEDCFIPKSRKMNKNKSHQKKEKNPVEEKSEMENALTNKDEEEEEEEEDEEYLVEQLSNTLFKLSINVPNAFYGGIIGRGGTIKKNLEKLTQTTIKVPRNNKGSVTINGATLESVHEAQNQIKSLLPPLRKRMRATHFLSIPLDHDEIKVNYNAFKEQILAAGFPGIAEDNFQSEHRLHLTLGVCVILNLEEELKAIKLLRKCRTFLQDLQTPFTVAVSGLETWSENINSVRIIYGTVVAPELQKFADRVYDAFLKNDLAINDYQRDYVKLHMTVLQNCYRTRDPPQKEFDASGIFERFSKFDFGIATKCNELQLCIIRSKGEDTNEPYRKIGVLNF